MTGPEVLDVARDAIVTLVLVASPLMLIGLVVGVVISLFQALTQIQEMTLVFVPKILAIFIAMLIALPFMADLLQGHMARLAARIVGGWRMRCNVCARRHGASRSAIGMKIDVSFLPALAATFMLVFARIGTMVMLLPGLGELSVPVRVRLDGRAGADRGAAAAPSQRLSDRPAHVRAGADDAGPGAADRRRARPDRAADDLGAAGRRLRDRPAAWARLRHRGRSDAGPAGRPRRQFPHHARRRR